jgi:xanthine dehydrogenase accessory factor
MTDDHREVYEAIVKANQAGLAVALATVIATQGSMPRHAGSKMLVYANGDIVGTIGGGAMESLVIKVALQSLQDGKARTESYMLNNLADGDPGICGGTATIFIEPLSIAPMLLVIGGGHVGKALAELGKWAGFRVVLSDDRPEYAHEGYVPHLERYVVCKPSEIAQYVTIDDNCYVCAVTRGLPIDVQLIPALLNTTAKYIGLIGSRRRWAITQKTLRVQYQLTPEQLARIHAPIGLEIGAESPKEIAISILAEMVMIRRGGSGKPMQWLGTDAELVD